MPSKDNDLIPSKTVTGWRVCMDYRKLNKATRKDHFPLPFIDQMLDKLAGQEYYCFLDGYSGYNQIAVHPDDQERPHSHVPMELLLSEGCSSAYAMDQVHSKGV